MIFKILFIISYTLLYPFIVRPFQTYVNTPPTETFSHWPEFEISDPWDSPTEEEYINDILEDSCEYSDYSDYKRRPFNIFGNNAGNYIGQYYQAGGETKHRIVLKQ